MQILLSNDDGVESPGLLLLHQALKLAGYSVTVVAPAKERSTVGHSLTLHKPLRIHHLDSDIYSVSGSPADCVYLALRHILKKKPDLVISGVNRGGNLGADIFYSGTVAAAREAVLADVPAIAVSLCLQFPQRIPDSTVHWETANASVLALLKKYPQMPKPKDIFLTNINVPNIPMNTVAGTKITSQGRRRYSDEVTESIDPRGKKYYWVGGGPVGFDDIEGTDCWAVANKFISISPLKIDTTHNECRESWKHFEPLIK